MAHPDDSILLAYTRQQPLGEDWQRVHLHIVGCEQCPLRCKQLTETSTVLSEMLTHFQYSQVYPSLTEKVFELAQNPAAQRLAYQKRQQAHIQQNLAACGLAMRRTLAGVGALVGSILAWPGHLFMPRVAKPRKNTMATVPMLSFVILLLLLLMFFAALIAIPFSKGSFRPFGLRNDIKPAQQSGVTIQSHSMTATSAVTGGATATSAPAMSQPRLKLCSKSFGIAFAAIRICGYNFTPGDKVKLTITTVGGQTKTLHAVFVDEQGTFQSILRVSRCKDYPASISAQDPAYSSEVILQLQNNDLGQCVVSTPMPMVPVDGKH